MAPLHAAVVVLCGALIPSAFGVYLDVSSTDSIKQSASLIADHLLSYFVPAVRLELLPFPPYYWWQSGAIWGGMVDYAAYTGDTRHNAKISSAILSQVGPANDFMLIEKSQQTGNDDQGFWALTVMSALENDFPEPPSPNPSWLAIADNVFNSQVNRWDTTTCNGGLRWQAYPENVWGWDYKNSVSNGVFFQLSARLARYTHNQTYLAWANQAWDWMTSTNLITSDMRVLDGADVKKDCRKLNRIQWSYNAAILMHGAAVMYDLAAGSQHHTDPLVQQQGPLWRDRVQKLVHVSSNSFLTSFPNSTGIMYEAACEPLDTCNTDQRSFKAYFARWLAKTTVLAPFTLPTIQPILLRNAAAAARSCTSSSGLDRSTKCGFKWYLDRWDGSDGAGEQLSALEVIISPLALRGWQPRSIGMAANALAGLLPSANTQSETAPEATPEAAPDPPPPAPAADAAAAGEPPDDFKDNRDKNNPSAAPAEQDFPLVVPVQVDEPAFFPDEDVMSLPVWPPPLHSTSNVVSALISTIVPAVIPTGAIVAPNHNTPSTVSGTDDHPQIHPPVGNVLVNADADHNVSGGGGSGGGVGGGGGRGGGRGGGHGTFPQHALPNTLISHTSDLNLSPAHLPGIRLSSVYSPHKKPSSTRSADPVISTVLSKQNGGAAHVGSGGLGFFDPGHDDVKQKDGPDEKCATPPSHSCARPNECRARRGQLTDKLHRKQGEDDHEYKSRNSCPNHRWGHGRDRQPGWHMEAPVVTTTVTVTACRRPCLARASVNEMITSTFKPSSSGGTAAAKPETKPVPAIAPAPAPALASASAAKQEQKSSLKASSSPPPSSVTAQPGLLSDNIEHNNSNNNNNNNNTYTAANTSINPDDFPIIKPVSE